MAEGTTPLSIRC